jgi:hypothetical protein
MVSYYDATNKDLLFAYWDIAYTRWSTSTLDDVGDVGKYTSLALDSANLPYISYYDETNGDLKLKYRTLFGWAPAVTVDGEDAPYFEDVGMYSSIALDSLGNPHISYYDYTDGALKYAFWEGSVFPAAGGNWNKTILQDVGDVGLFTSLKIYKPDDSRHICYYDYTNGDLMYARYQGGIWEFQTVDSTGDVGLFCSLDLIGPDPMNPVPPIRIAISYYSNSRGDLKLALNGYTLPPALYYLPVEFKD